ncbi:MAG TPA: RNA polymerase sigma factor [Polyangiaceae bacterium]|nr:RNA polymerase sigma factor [Polyangiaceae bacterium]
MLDRLLDARVALPASSLGALELHHLFKETYDGIWRLLRGLGVPADRLDDAAQQVFLVYAERHADVVRGSEKSFLFGTALRVAHVVRRGVPREVPGEIDFACSDQPGVDELTDQKRARQVLDLILDQLEPELRDVFVLYELEGFTMPEIAALVEVPLGTAASRLRRGRDRFSALVRRYSTFGPPSANVVGQ